MYPLNLHVYFRLYLKLPKATTIDDHQSRGETSSNYVIYKA